MATTHMHGGIGESMKRKEDSRFIHGKGNYIDDLVLPGMLHMAILRSPHAHARIKSIDTAAASAMPGVIAVVTGELMAQHKLAWMPTLSYDTQAVLGRQGVTGQQESERPRAGTHEIGAVDSPDPCGPGGKAKADGAPGCKERQRQQEVHRREVGLLAPERSVAHDALGAAPEPATGRLQRRRFEGRSEETVREPGFEPGDATGGGPEAHQGGNDEWGDREEPDDEPAHRASSAPRRAS